MVLHFCCESSHRYAQSELLQHTSDRSLFLERMIGDTSCWHFCKLIFERSCTLAALSVFQIAMLCLIQSFRRQLTKDYTNSPHLKLALLRARITAGSPQALFNSILHHLKFASPQARLDLLVWCDSSASLFRMLSHYRLMKDHVFDRLTNSPQPVDLLCNTIRF